MKKKVAFALCTALMLCSMSVAALAAEPMTEADTVSTMISAADTLPGISAYPAEVRASEENGVYRLEKVYYLTAKDDPATIPTADFEREGRTYTLLDLLKNDQTETDTREHIEVVTLGSKTKDMAEILKMLEPKLEVKTEDGYEGVLSLDHTTIQVEAAGYGTSSRTVTAERTYPNLSDADVSLVPKSVNENGRTLTLADVSWQEAAVDPTDGYDIPIRYTAVASYTGTATSKYATGYTVTADYKGDVTRTSCDTVVYTAVFSSVGNEAATDSSSFNWLWLLLPVGAAALGGCGYAGYKGYRHYINKKKRVRRMKKYLTTLLAACCMLAAFSMPASALEYHFDGPDAGLFGRPTSDDTIYVTMDKPVNTDRSKNAAYIPPAFGSPTSYTLNAGELLTPNLVSGSVTGTTSGTGGVTVLPPMTSGSSSGNTGSYTPVKYTAVTKDLYYSGGSLGTLKIPTLGLSVKVYQGTDADALRKGAGHFASTSIWEGNVAIAGHNRGVNNHFGKIHTLDIGDAIKLTTQLGTRSYEVYSVSKIGVDDTSILSDSTENIITLVTCVMNQPDYRWCVQARQK